MKMISMGGVIIRAQRDTKNIAGAAANLFEELLALPAGVPILKHGDDAAITERKPCDIKSICKGMFRPC